MKILFLSLNGDPLSRQPKNYGGCGRTLRLLVENLENAYLAGEASCFQTDVTEKCILLGGEDVLNIRNGAKLSPYLFGDDYDIVVYAEPGIILNTPKPQLTWAVGAQEPINPHIKNLLLHNRKWQKPVIQSFGTKVHEFVLGIEVPPFQEYQKENIIFTCGNQYPQVNSHTLAQWAVRNKIKVIFAGPISESYQEQFLQEIDYNWAVYIGQINEGEKIKLLKKARCYVDLPSHDLNGPRLGAKQAWSHNCAVISTPAGVMPEVVKQNENGFLIRDENDFINAVNSSSRIDQFRCYQTSLQWSVEKMVESFKNVVSEVTK